jgi:hypothetical protein
MTYNICYDMTMFSVDRTKADRTKADRATPALLFAENLLHSKNVHSVISPVDSIIKSLEFGELIVHHFKSQVTCRESLLHVMVANYYLVRATMAYNKGYYPYINLVCNGLNDEDSRSYLNSDEKVMSLSKMLTYIIGREVKLSLLPKGLELTFEYPRTVNPIRISAALLLIRMLPRILSNIDPDVFFPVLGCNLGVFLLDNLNKIAQTKDARSTYAMYAVFLYSLRLPQLYTPDYMFGADGPRTYLMGSYFPVHFWIDILSTFNRRKFLCDITSLRDECMNLDFAIKLLDIDKEKNSE